MTIYQSLLSLIFPRRCIECHAWLESAEKEAICPTCFSRLNFLKVEAHLPKIGKKYFEEAWSVVAYEPPVLDWIHQYKYHRQFHLGPALSDLFLKLDLPWKKYDAIVPVPLHWWRQVRRGFNPSHLLAHQLAQKTGRPLWHCLKKKKSTPPQAKLSSEERLKNMKDVFTPRLKMKTQIKKSRLLLVDDVLTTGSTANECARVLMKMGAAQVDVLTLARPL
ncbi:MAG: ComF family protein [Deltaproteobacteria bacterium]|nr:ComF family protein [Deltaproteobacteria bacterium]